MICPFIVKQKVVCIVDLTPEALGFFLNYGLGVSIPQVNDIVTIRRLGPTTCRCGKCGDKVGILLEEHIQPTVEGLEPMFVWTCFRPLQDRPSEADTDISVFYPSLKFTNHSEKEPT